MTPQAAGEDNGRSKLANAFARWRLNTCDATVDELSGSLSMQTTGDTPAAAAEGLPHAPRHVQSLKEMWETASSGGEGSRGQNRQLHDIVLKKMSADRPLPGELCEAYEREMVERIDRRQAENNIPILPLPIY